MSVEGDAIRTVSAPGVQILCPAAPRAGLS